VGEQQLGSSWVAAGQQLLQRYTRWAAVPPSVMTWSLLSLYLNSQVVTLITLGVIQVPPPLQPLSAHSHIAMTLTAASTQRQLLTMTRVPSRQE